MTQGKAIFAVVGLLFAISVGYLGYRAIGHSPAAYSCVAGPDEVCASDQFYADYLTYEKLQADITAQQKSSAMVALQQKQDQLYGMAQRLIGQVPRGYQWCDKGSETGCSGKKLRFVRTPPAPPPVANVPSSPAPPAKP